MGDSAESVDCAVSSRRQRPISDKPKFEQKDQNHGNIPLIFVLDDVQSSESYGSLRNNHLFWFGPIAPGLQIEKFTEVFSNGLLGLIDDRDYIVIFESILSSRQSGP